MNFIYFIITLLTVITFNKNIYSQEQIFTDTRDNKQYKTVKIGNSIWMSENMAYNTRTNCVSYKNADSNFTKYGYLYNYDAAVDACPVGWHLASDEDWIAMEKIFGMSDDELHKNGWRGNKELVAELLKKGDILKTGWGIHNKKFYKIDADGAYWTSTRADKNTIYARYITDKKIRRWTRPNVLNYAVRCVKNTRNISNLNDSIIQKEIAPSLITKNNITEAVYGKNETNVPKKNKMSLVLQTGNSGRITYTQFHTTQKYMLSVDDRNKIVIWDLNQRKQYASLSFNNNFNDVSFVNDTVMVVAIGSQLEFWDFTSNTKIKTIKTDNECFQVECRNEKIFFLSRNVNHINNWNKENIVNWNTDTLKINKFYISETGETIATVKDKNITFYTYKNKHVIGKKKIKSIDIHISDSTKTISIATKSAAIITYSFKDKFKKTRVLVNNRKFKRYKTVAFSGDFGIVGNTNDIITIYNIKTGKVLDNIKNKSFSIHSLSVNNDGSLFAVGGESGIVKLYDFEKRIELNNLGGLVANVTSIKFADDSLSVILGYNNGQIKKWNLKTHEIKTLHIKRSLIDKFTQARYEIHGLDNGTPIVYKYKTTGLLSKTEKIKYYALKIDSTFSTIDLNKLRYKKVKEKINVLNNKYEYSKYINVNDYNDFSLISLNKQINIPKEVKLLSASQSLDKNIVLVSANNGLIYFVNNSTANIKLQMLSPGDKSFFYGTLEGYYFSSKSSLKSIGVRYKKMLLGFEQIDLLYNRPDKILNTLNYYDKEYISLLESAYFKRLKKLGVEKSELEKIDNLPETITSLSELPINTKKDNWVVNINANGKTKDLKAIHLLINGIPIFGKTGKLIKGKEIDEDITVSLSPGENHIQLFVENESGLKSIREHSNVMLKQTYMPSLYVLAIGSGSFNNKSYNLEYAKKDAVDIANTFKVTKTFKTINTRTLIDNDVTNKKVKKAIEWLKKAHKDDIIIVFFAGHGVLDNNLDYYLSSADIDFTYPEKEGINYNNFENLIGNLQCRNKVLFIDACHSGELDKEELAINTESEITTGDVVFRAAGVGVKHKAGKSTFELSKNLFADLRQNSGVIVVSSAGGAEYAFEGGDWSNGVFTYSFISGLKNKYADLNNDKKITLNELQQYLSVKVPELTNGKQTPTSRVENLEKDIILW